MQKTALLINPWIYDFSAYDLWMKPVGLLRIGAYLRKEGFSVKFFDCLDSRARKDGFNCGKFNKVLLEKPKQIQNTPRPFYRYGVMVEKFIQFLNETQRPDIVYVSSGMTYWYLGVQEVVRIIRSIWGDIQIVLGGVYTVLCRDHALKHSGASEIWNGNRVNDYPAWDLLSSTKSVVIQTSLGCPFNCDYCGIKLLSNDFCQRPFMEVADEIEFCINKYNSEDIAFFDDALLVNSDIHIKPLLREIIQRGINVRFHTPNGIHARFVDKEIAVLLKKAGFASIRISFETSKQDRADNKVTNEEFLQAVNFFKQAGFTAKDIGVYTMFGSMDDAPEDIIKDIEFVTEKARVPIKLSAYALVPGSADFKRWGFSGDLDPLWHNKTIFPLLNKKYTEPVMHELKQIASQRNRALING